MEYWWTMNDAMNNECVCYFQVSNLFPRDEMEEILQELIPVMKKEFPRRPPTNEKLYEYFLTRTRANLHVVLCFSPVSTGVVKVIEWLRINGQETL